MVERRAKVGVGTFSRPIEYVNLTTDIQAMAIRIRELRDIHKRAIQLLILHRWSAGRGQGSNGLVQRVAEELGVKPDTVRHWRTCDNFRAEFGRQLRIFKRNFDDIQLADRRERVKLLDSLFFLIDGTDVARVNLKLKILQELREETGGNVRRIEQTVDITHRGTNMPPAARTYEEWLEQNAQMERAMEEDPELPAGQVSEREGEPPSGTAPGAEAHI